MDLSGNIALDIDLSKPSSVVIGKSSPEPITVDLQTTTGDTTTRFLEYNDAARPLVANVRTTTGNVDIVNHPAFQGDYEFSSTVGSIGTQEREISDPTGQGRRRVIETHRSGGIGNRVWRGTVQWLERYHRGSSGREHVKGRLGVKTTTGNIKVVW